MSESDSDDSAEAAGTRGEGSDSGSNRGQPYSTCHLVDVDLVPEDRAAPKACLSSTPVSLLPESSVAKRMERTPTTAPLVGGGGVWKGGRTTGPACFPRVGPLFGGVGLRYGPEFQSQERGEQGGSKPGKGARTTLSTPSPGAVHGFPSGVRPFRNRRSRGEGGFFRLRYAGALLPGSGYAAIHEGMVAWVHGCSARDLGWEWYVPGLNLRQVQRDRQEGIGGLHSTEWLPTAHSTGVGSSLRGIPIAATASLLPARMDSRWVCWEGPHTLTPLTGP